MLVAKNKAPEISVAAVDDHEAIHAAVELWCAHADPPIRVAGIYYSVDALLREHPSGAGDVTVVVFDLELESRRPAFTALDRVIRAGHRVIVYSHITDGEIVLKTLEAGAVTYLAKCEGKKHLIDAIRAAGTDEPYVGPRMAAAMYGDRTVGRPNLTPREREVLISWFQTESKDLVARGLSVTPSTVRTHLQRIRAKYAAVGRPAPTKAALVARGIQDGIVSVDDL
jgi:DNA-binding NarL/FixJ family response regulator